ncbi:hypothetical protein ACJ73_00276 [Blastomyces percursus]|uniref:Enoyl reductase (ER) domain-containing protein n=1 Tax=Blastomyces percursus TaxID=1658174 RepID=A0A1J9QHK2_9EURO|nr:hypothetical protein ACJ73_00276 [Blastomyces percursus]
MPQLTQDIHGKLILVEFTNAKCVREAFTLGLLPDWWSCSEDYRQCVPYITEKEWNDVLIENGVFWCVDSCVHDNAEESYRELSMMISPTIVESEESLFAPELMIVNSAAPSTQASITRDLKCQLTAIGTLVHEAVSVQEAASAKHKASFYILILEVDTHLLPNLDESKTVLWVTGNPEKYPEFDMVLGLGRVLTNENATLKFTTLPLEEPCANIGQNVRHILKATKLLNTAQNHNYEREFVERAGVLEIPRLIETPRLNHEVHSRAKPQQRQVQPFGSGLPLKLSIEDLGPIGVDEVEIKVHAIGVNFMDLLYPSWTGTKRLAIAHLSLNCREFFICASSSYSYLALIGRSWPHQGRRNNSNPRRIWWHRPSRDSDRANFWKASWECIGRFLEIGKKDIWSYGKLPMFPFAKNVTFSAIDLASVSHLVRNSFTAVMELMGAGKLHVAHPLQVFKVSRIEDAFRSMQTGKNFGKMVVEIDADDPVIVIRAVPRQIYVDQG